jgi:chromosome segregation ATPase
MTPAPDSSATATDALRKQLILAQVQLMELEDLRDELRTELAATQALLAQSQTLADNTLQTQDRTEAARADLQEECTGLHASLHQAREQEIALASRLTQAQADTAARERALQDVQAVLATLRSRVEQLEAERRALKSSRSWRWTAPLRSLERFFRRSGDRTP